MAATKRNARFYVYRFDDASGQAAYIGKGSTNRLQKQARRLGLQGYEIARFWKEADAYKFEVDAIAEHQPMLNKHKGGNGSRAAKIRQPKREAWQIEMDRVGSRVYVARFLLSRCLAYLDPSKVDAIRAIAQ